MISLEEKIKELLALLTLEEKIGMIHGAGLFRTEGVERLGIPPLYMSDGPMGVRAEFADNEWRNIGNNDDFVSYLPCNSAIASTWSRELAAKAGSVLGEEARGRGKDVILAPGINIKRSPLCGRNFEYMSEDPRLIEELVVPMVQEIQKNDVAACVKHFAVNCQETERLWVDTIVEERALREIYFPGFKAAVEKGGIFALMGAYNRLNGEHCCTGKHLLDDILRREWKYDGMVVSDWGGVHDTAKAAESSLDIEMDVTYDFENHKMAKPLFEKIKSGEISEALIDEKIKNILRLMFRLNMIGEGKAHRKNGTYNTKEHQEALLEIARESVVLLKNEENLLPLKKEKIGRVAVIGQNAAAIHSNGGGSAEIKALYEITPLMGIKKLLGGNVQVAYAPGYVIPDKEENADINWQADSTKKAEENETGTSENEKAAVLEKKKSKELEERKKQYRKEALELAKKSDTVIFIGGLNHDYDVEGKDRSDMKLPYEQDELLSELLQICPNTIVVMYAGSPVEMPWKEDAKAILWSYYAGMEGGTAIAEILFGDVNPSAKLAETFIKETSQCPAHTIGTFGKEDVITLLEGVMVGYRYYDTEGTEVNFPFGHGLSYSSFAYCDLKLEKVNQEDCPKAEVRVTFEVKNTSACDGQEIVQIYVSPEKSNVKRPFHELKAFEKLMLKAGESRQVEVVLTEEDFSYFDEEKKSFVCDYGVYNIQIAASSRDIRLSERISLDL